MIPNVSPGDPIRAGQINPVIDAVNALAQPYGPDAYDLLQEDFDGNNLPWYVDANTLRVYRPVCSVNGNQMIASQYTGQSCEGQFFCGYNDQSAVLGIYDETQKEDWERSESGLSVKHWSFVHVYDLFPVSVELDGGQKKSGPPCRAAHYDLHPYFGDVSASPSSDCMCQLCALPSADVSAATENPLKIASWTRDNWASQVDVYAPNSQCSCDLSTTLTTGTKIAAWTKDGVNWTDILAPNGGGGDCSCEMSAVISAETYQDAAYRTNTKVAQFKDCQGRTTDVYAPDSVRMRGNVGAQTKTAWSNNFQFQTMTSSNV